MQLGNVCRHVPLTASTLIGTVMQSQGFYWHTPLTALTLMIKPHSLCTYACVLDSACVSQRRLQTCPPHGFKTDQNHMCVEAREGVLAYVRVHMLVGVCLFVCARARLCLRLRLRLPAKSVLSCVFACEHACVRHTCVRLCAFVCAYLHIFMICSCLLVCMCVSART